MFHYDQSLQQNDEFRCTQKEPLSSSWVNINGINFCSGGWQRYLFGLKAELGFKPDAEENYVLIEDPLLRLFDIWDIIFNKQVRLFRHQRIVYLSWLGNTVFRVANSRRFGTKGASSQNWECKLLQKWVNKLNTWPRLRCRIGNSVGNSGSYFKRIYCWRAVGEHTVLWFLIVHSE